MSNTLGGLASVAFLLSLDSACAAGTPSAPELKAEITQLGAKSVVDRLVKQDRWDVVAAQIARGQQQWLDLVPLLAAGTDAGPSEDLGIALATALPRHPEAVLRVADEKRLADGGIIGIERVCGVPFIEDTEPKGYGARALRGAPCLRSGACGQKA